MSVSSPASVLEAAVGSARPQPLHCSQACERYIPTCKQTKKKGLANETIVRNARNTAQKAFNACVSRDGYEACVNADFALRPRLPLPYCFYDKTTGKNLAITTDRIVTTGKCNARSDTTSPASKVSTPSTPGGTPNTPPTPAGGGSGTQTPAGEEQFPVTSTRARRRLLLCACSPSGRGYSKQVGQTFVAGFTEILAALEKAEQERASQKAQRNIVATGGRS